MIVFRTVPTLTHPELDPELHLRKTQKLAFARAFDLHSVRILTFRVPARGSALQLLKRLPVE